MSERQDSDSGAKERAGGSHLTGIFADAIAVAPCREGRAAIDWPVQQVLDALEPAPKGALSVWPS